MSATILYLDYLPGDFVQEAKLAGIRRYAAANGWEVVAVPKAEFAPGAVPALFKRLKPAGVVVECSTGRTDLPPTLFGRVPVVYLDADRSFHGGRAPLVVPDNAAIVRAALRELRANRASALAFVGFHMPAPWDSEREHAFLELAAAAKTKPFVFPRGDDCKAGSPERLRRLASWLAALPRHCGVMAANDRTSIEVVTAASAAGLRFPRDFTLVGVDDRDEQAADLSVSTIQVDHERAGWWAAALLGRVMSGKTAQAVMETFGPLMTIRRDSTRGFGRREPYIRDAVEIIRREACDGLTPAALAKRMPGSRRHFERRFREAMGHGVLAEIQSVQLEKVCALLAGTDTAIDAIADFCGFGSGRALRTLFLRTMGVSMKEFRGKAAKRAGADIL